MSAIIQQQIEEARAEGFSDEDIKSLFAEDKFVQGALLEGFTLDEIAAVKDQETAEGRYETQVAENKQKQKAGLPPTVFIPGIGISGPVTSGMTQEVVDEQIQRRTKEGEAETPKEEEPIDENDPSYKRIAAGLAAEIALAEGGKTAGLLAGSSLGAAGGPAAPLTVPAGAAIGYVAGAIGGGVSGSIAAQRIEGRKSINWGRVAVDTMLNLVPGSKLSKGPKVLIKASEVIAKRPVASTAIIGGIASPLGAIASEYYETGEIPDAGELASSGGVGFVLGAGLGKSAEKMNKLLKKMSGKSASEIQSAVDAGDQDAVDYINAITSVPDPNNPDKTRLLNVNDVSEWLSTSLKPEIAPTSVIGKDAMQAIRDAKNIIEGGEFVGGAIGSRVNDIVRKSANPEEMNGMIRDYVTGVSQNLPKEAPADLAQKLSYVRAQIKNYQESILDMHYKGQRRLPDELLKTIEDSQKTGDYLTGSYRWFDDKGYEPTPQQTKSLINALMTNPRVDIDRREVIETINKLGEKQKIVNPNFGKEIELPPMNEVEASKYIAELKLKKASNPDELHNWIFSQNAGILKKKKDLSPELREYLGEYKDIGTVLERTMSKLARLKAYDQADFLLSSTLKEMGVLKRAEEGIDGLQPINLRRGEAQLGGEVLYGPPELQTALNSVYAAKIDDNAQDIAGKIIEDSYKSWQAGSKAMATVYNWYSYSTNLLTSAALSVGMGKNPLKGLGKNLKLSASSFESVAKKLDVEDIKTIQKAKELGVFPTGVTFADIKAGLQVGPVGKTVSKVVGPAGKLYSASDIAIRYGVFEDNARQIRQFAPGVSEDLALKEAADITNQTFQNYDYVPKALRTASTYGVIDQFGTFFLDLIRTQYNHGKLMKAMINGSYADGLEKRLGVKVNREAIKKEGIKRAAWTAGIVSAAGVFNQVNNSFGVDENKERALRESVLPDYMANAPLLINYDIEKNKVRAANTSYILPQQALVGPLVSGLRGQGFVDAVQSGTKGLLGNITGEGTFALNTLYEVVQNYDPKKQGPISSAPDLIGQFVDRADYAFTKTLQPKFIDAFKKARFDPPTLTAAKTLGIRWNDFDMDRSILNHSKKTKDAMNTLRAEISYARNRVADKKMTQEEFDSIYREKNEYHRAQSMELAKHIKNYRTLGYTDEQIVGILGEGAIGSVTLLNALNGVPTDAPKILAPKISEQLDEFLASTPDNQRMNELVKIGREDPAKGRALREAFKQYRKDQFLKISPVDKLVRGLGTTDGERALYINDQMNRSDNPQAVLDGFVKKGLVPKIVQGQIQTLRKNAQKSY